MIVPITNQVPSLPKPLPNNHFCCSIPNCKCNKLLYCLAVFLVLIILSGVAYLYHLQNQPPAPVSVVTKVTPPTTNSTPSHKTYTNQNITFQYPNDWELNNDNSDYLVISNNKKTAENFGEILILGPQNYGTSENFNDKTNDYLNYTLFSNANLGNHQPKVTGSEKIIVSKITSTCYHININPTPNPNDIKLPYKTTKWIFIPDPQNPNLFYNIRLNGEIPQLDQILSTFRFLDPPKPSAQVDKFIDNNTESYSEDTGISNQKRYVSRKLGISFLYLTKVDSENFSVKEEGQKIYVYPSNTTYTNGQFVEVHSKNPQESLKDTITTQFLTGKDPSRCFVEISTFPTYPSNYSVAEISYPQDTEFDLEAMMEKMNYCSPDYAKTNGIRYFLEDNLHPTKFVFFSIGQYSIPATSDKSWQNTLQFLDQPTPTTTSNDRQIGYIKKISEEDRTITVDYVQWINCQTEDCPNGYKVVNDNSLLRNFTLLPNLEILLQTYSNTTNGDFSWNQKVSLNQLINWPNYQSRLYWFTIQNKEIMKIEEQYQP